MEASVYQLSLLVGSTGLISVYYTTLRKFPEQFLHLLFWNNLLTYVAFCLMFFFQHNFMYAFNMHHLEAFMYDYEVTNLPFYILLGLVTLGGIVIMEYLSKKFPISMIIAVSQISIITSTIGYVFLGSTVTKIVLVGNIIVFLGALISGFPYFSFKNPIEPLLKLSPSLIKGAFISALLSTATSVITFICTAKFNPETQAILNHMSSHLHRVPLHSMTPAHFNIGAQLAISIFLFAFIVFFRPKTGSIFKFFTDHPMHNLKSAALFAGSNILYFMAFGLMKDKTLLSSIYQLYIPMTLLCGFLLVQEKPTKPQLIGAAIIVFGAFFAVIF